MKLTRPIQTFLFLLVRALVVQPVQDTKLHSSELSLLSSRSGSIDRLNQTSLSSNISANRVAVFCDGAEYGRDLVTDDCKDAITAIKRSTQQVVFGERSADPQTWDVGLPSRQIGIQGLCTVQLEFKPGRSSAIATSLEVFQAAVAVLGTCVAGAGINTGGLAINIGGDNNLGVALAPYEPHVQCFDGSVGPPGSTVPPLNSCNAIVELMFATKDVTSFGKAGSGAAKIVPGMDASPDRLCVLGIDTRGPLEDVSWYDIWQAAVAVTGMCVRDGKTGKATDLGANGDLFITMWGPGPSPGLSLFPGNMTSLTDAISSEALNESWSTS